MGMTLSERSAYAADFLGEVCLPLLEAKGRDYSQQEANDNFRRLAADMGLTPYQVWLVYWRKHVDAITAWVRTGQGSEPIAQRIADAINYLLILASMLEEDRRVTWPTTASTCTSKAQG